jgi:hypothetical protein
MERLKGSLKDSRKRRRKKEVHSKPQTEKLV